MKIESVRRLALPDVRVIRYARFADERGYFSETFRRSDWDRQDAMPELSGIPLVQVNESFSRHGVARGLHFQWSPFMGKLVRTLHGRMVDIVLDIRPESPTLGKALMYDMPADPDASWSEWIWVPPGFAHGNFFLESSRIEYFCSSEYSPGTEAGISPLSDDIDWSLCEPALKGEWDALRGSGRLTLSQKDQRGFSLTQWLADPRSREFARL